MLGPKVFYVRCIKCSYNNVVIFINCSYNNVAKGKASDRVLRKDLLSKLKSACVCGSK